VSLVASTGPSRGRSQRSLLVSVGTIFRTDRRPALCLRTVRLASADSPPPSCERSAPGCADRLSPLLLELCFSVALSWGLFLGLVGLL
jgi:hypothetical protein